MKKSYLLLVALFVLFVGASCSDDDNEGVVPAKISTGLYVLNSGLGGSNNASLTHLNYVDSVVSQNVFATANGQDMGDTGQDVLVYGSKMYLSMSGSDLIFVTDLKSKIIETLKFTEAHQPRSLVAHKGKVFASFFNGAVASIDTLNFESKITKSGLGLEEIAVVNDQLYVAVSGYNGDFYNPTRDSVVSVFDCKTLEKVKDIEVVLNPTKLCAYGNDIYVLSMGDYGAIPVTLQHLDAVTGKLSTITIPTEYNAPFDMAIGKGGVLYLGCGGYDENWNTTGSIYAYDKEANSFSQFIKGDLILYTYSVNTNLTTGDVYLGLSDFKNTGDVMIYSSEGELKGTIETGINPLATANVVE